MKLKKTPALHTFFTTYFAVSDAESPESDQQTAATFVTSAPADRVRQVVAQAKAFMADPEFPFEELGSEANRWFGDAEEGRAWLAKIVAALEGDRSSEKTAVVKDSNGAVLEEGDSVLVIKDLKVKGGSSDLKRGTMIKKIRLIGDPENIECRVDGSTLVLKTCFLKKA